jgi:Flp pilus assembly protein TadG
MKESGSTTVENVIWLPFLLLVLGSIIQFGLYFNARTAVQEAAYEAARQAAVDEKPVERAETVAYGFAGNVLPGWQKKERVSVTVEAPSRPKPGDEVRVNVNYEVPEFFSVLLTPAKLGSGWPLVKGSSTTTIEERP